MQLSVQKSNDAGPASKISLRDYIAIRALAAIISSDVQIRELYDIAKKSEVPPMAAVAKAAYHYADMMLAVRNGEHYLNVPE